MRGIHALYFSLILAVARGIHLQHESSTYVSAPLLQRLRLFAEYAAAASCHSNHDSSNNTHVKCSTGICPTVEKADSQILHKFKMRGHFPDATGFVAVDRTHQVLVVAFRGTHTKTGKMAAFEGTLISVDDICSGCRVHRVFWKSWRSVSETIEATVEEAVASYPGYDLVFTGSSTGGAAAALGATVLRSKGFGIDLYTYGGLRPGNQALAEYITSFNASYRVTHANDFYPSLPWYMLGYRHFGPEYWITSSDSSTVRPSDIEIFRDMDSTAGNRGEFPKSDSAHRWYFVDLFECPF